MGRAQRKRYFIDPAVQAGLMKRLVVYIGASMIFFTMPIAFAKTVMHPEIMFTEHVLTVYATHWPILLMMIAFLPFALNDAVRFSNRFAGPIYRMRCELKRFENRQPMNRIKFRKRDFWHDLADSMNMVSDRIAELEKELEESQLENERIVAERNHAAEV